MPSSCCVGQLVTRNGLQEQDMDVSIQPESHGPITRRYNPRENQVVQDSLFNLFRIADARVSSSSLFFFLFFSRFSDPSSFFPETELKAGRRQHAQPYIDGDDGQTTKRRRPRVYTTYRRKTTTSVCCPVLLFNRDIKSTGIGFSGSRREPPIQLIIRGHQMVEKQASNQSSVYVTVKDQRHSSQDFFSWKNKAHFWQKQNVKIFCLVEKKRTREERRDEYRVKREREKYASNKKGEKRWKNRRKRRGKYDPVWQ